MIDVNIKLNEKDLETLRFFIWNTDKNKLTEKFKDDYTETFINRLDGVFEYLNKQLDKYYKK